MQGGPCLLPYPLRRLDGGQDDQGDEAAPTRIQAALSGDLAVFQALPDSRQFGIRPGQCRGPVLPNSFLYASAFCILFMVLFPTISSTVVPDAPA